ncbi:hypothetical protein [Streptomyces sp. NPDC056405]|uniref:hypothetical protein n=1 Tax=Streptomyces sp. NPDC056405 TaxID=3345811 RepID=UPI0035D8E1F3
MHFKVDVAIFVATTYFSRPAEKFADCRDRRAVRPGSQGRGSCGQPAERLGRRRHRSRRSQDRLGDPVPPPQPQ